jgi:hypothetical protein
MSDRELLRFGKSARYMCTPEENFGKRAASSVRFNRGKQWRNGMAASPPR